MDSKLRDKIAEALAVQGVTDGYICDKTKAIADSILSILAHELEKARFWDEHVESLPEIANNIKQLRAAAEKWRRVKEIAKYKGNCGECPNDSLCMEFPTSACHICEGVVNALSEKCDDGSGRIRAEWAKEEGEKA